MPLDPLTVTVLSTMMQTSAAMYAIAFVVFEIRRGAFARMNFDEQAKQGVRYHHMFYRVAFWGAYVVATIALCAFALISQVEWIAHLAEGTFMTSLVGLGYLMLVEPASVAIESLVPFGNSVVVDEMIAYYNAHPEEKKTLAGKSDREILKAAIKNPEISKRLLERLQAEVTPWYARWAVRRWQARQRRRALERVPPPPERVEGPVP